MLASKTSRRIAGFFLIANSIVLLPATLGALGVLTTDSRYPQDTGFIRIKFVVGIGYCVGLILNSFYFREFHRRSVKYGRAWWFASGSSNLIGMLGISTMGLGALAGVLCVPTLLSYWAMFPKRRNPTGNAV